MTAPHEWLTVPEVIEYARMSRTEVFEELKTGRLRGYQAAGKNGKWRVHKDDVDAWIRQVPPPPVANPRFARRSAS